MFLLIVEKGSMVQGKNRWKVFYTGYRRESTLTSDFELQIVSNENHLAGYSSSQWLYSSET